MSGFYIFYNYGHKAHGGTSRIGSGWRGVYMQPDGKTARVLDWSTGEIARVSLRDFDRIAKPDQPRARVVRRCLKRVGARGDLAAAARAGV